MSGEEWPQAGEGEILSEGEWLSRVSWGLSPLEILRDVCLFRCHCVVIGRGTAGILAAPAPGEVQELIKSASASYWKGGPCRLIIHWK